MGVREDAVLNLAFDGRRAEQGLDKLRGSVTALSSGFLAVRQVLSDIATVAGAAFDAAKEAAAVVDVERTFQQIGTSIDDLRASTAGLLSDFELMQRANLADSMGINAEALAGLGQVAEAVAASTGKSIPESFDKLINASGSMRAATLATMGIIVNAKDANEEYARANNRVAKELTEVEKRQAFVNAVLEAGAPLIDLTATAGASAAETFDRLEAAQSNLATELGRQLLPGITVITDAIGDLVQETAEAFRLNRLFEQESAKADAVFAFIQTRNELQAEVAKWENRFKEGAISEVVLLDRVGKLKFAINGVQTEIRKIVGVPRNMRIGSVGDEAEEAAGKTGKVTAAVRGLAVAQREVTAAVETRVLVSQGAFDLIFEAEVALQNELELQADRRLGSLEIEEEVATETIAIHREVIEITGALQDRQLEKTKEIADETKDIYRELLQQVSSIAVSIGASVASESFKTIEAVVAGEKVALDEVLAKMVSGLMISVGTQLIGFGLTGVVRGAINSADPLAPGSGAGQVLIGGAAIAAGITLGGSGAVLGGLASRFLGDQSAAAATRIGATGSDFDRPRVNRPGADGTGDSRTVFVINAPIYDDQSKIARDQSRLRRRANRDLLER